MTPLWIFFALIALAAPASVVAAGDAEAGQAKSATCAGCHGVDGNSLAPTFPKLAGQHQVYLVKQLQEYRSGVRVNEVMNGLAAPLSDADIADLAAFFASQEGTAGAAAEDSVELGERVYRSGNVESGVAACAACHGPAGKGNPMANYPSLHGQHAMYTSAQLQMFRSRQRANDVNEKMRGVAGDMTDEEIKAVSEYIQGLN